MKSRIRLALLGVAVALAALAAVRLHSGAPPAPQPPGAIPVTITDDPSRVSGCTLVRPITLSGRIGEGIDAQDESDRDEDLRSLASDAGGNAVLVLERTPDYLRGRVYRCPAP